VKATVQQEIFWEGIQTVSRIVPSKAILPIISNVLLKTEGNELTLRATDLDISISTKFEADVTEEGSITVPAKTLSDITRKLFPGPFLLSSKENKLEIACGPEDEKGYRFNSTILGMSPDEFPELPDYADGTAVHPDGESLRMMVEKTEIAVSLDETRPVLNGIFTNIKEQDMTMVAMDGHRLARIIKALPEPLSSEVGVIVPAKALSHLGRLLQSTARYSEENPLKRLIIGENHVVFELERTVLFSRVIEGPYPDFEQVIPKSSERKMIVQVEELIPALERVSTFSSSDTHQVCFSISQGKLEISASGSERGEAKENVKADYDGDDFKIGYNANYLLEILRRMESDEVIFEFNTPVSAGLVKPVNQPEGQDYLCLIMPLRLNGI
jgi:DNA polymerase-3 subunit beta